MSSIDLMVLGLIKAKPKSAYEINRLMEVDKINTWIKISPRAIYRNIRELAKKGYIVGKKKKEGNMPEKMIYSITDMGTNFFLELMTQSSSHPKNMYFDYGPFLANLDLVDKVTGLDMLENLKKKFHREQERLSPFLDKMESYPFGGKAVLSHYKVIFDSLNQWIDELIEEFKKEKKA